MDLVQRAKNIVLSPNTEWGVIETEPATTGGLITGYAVPLAAIGAVAGFIGSALIGTTLPFVGHYRTPIVAALVGAVVAFGMALVGVFVLSLIIDALAPTFGAQKNQIQALKVAVYSYTPAWLAGVLQIVPLLGVLGIFAAFYGMYLLYLGLPRLMKASQDKALPYTVVVIVCAIVVSVIAVTVSGLVIGAAGMGALSTASNSSEVQFDKNSAMGKLQQVAKAVTTGNHVWDRREIIATIDRDQRLLRPQNFPKGTPGRGVGIYQAKGKRVMVMNLMGRLFMDPLDDPFAVAERELASQRLGGTVDAILIDFHAEATSEKMAFAHWLDGKVSLVVGTHTHVPTADWQILPGGTAYLSDAGMCGDYDSVIGMEKSVPIQRFLKKMPTERLSAARGEATLCGLYLETDEKTGLARRIEPVRVGGRLAPALPG